MNSNIVNELAPTGVLRVGINMSNFLLVTGETANGEPDGVSPNMARAIAKELGVGITFIRFPRPGELADAAADDVWDIGNIAAEPERAKIITFSPAYCEIQATYMLPANSPIQSVADVDKPGIRIAVAGRAAYDLWLTDNIRHATLHRAPSLDGSFELFVNEGLDVLAGLRPKLIKDQKKLPGSKILDESFTAVQQSIGCRPGRENAAAYLRDFVERSKADGFVASLIEKHGVEGRLSVAPPATS